MNQPTSRPKPVVLISMDGVGVAAPGPGNAVTLANTPNLDKYWPLYPHTYLEASGINVGLPAGVDGNSEVGHMAMGAGKIIFQDLPRIDNAINNGSFFQNPELLGAFEHAKQHKSKVHIMGIVGTGMVHGARHHLSAVLDMAVKAGIDADKLFIHVISDGRDSAPNIVLDVINKINAECISKRIGRVASLVGRYYAMDRDLRWERTQLAYDLLTKGKGHIITDLATTVDASYKRGKTDEFLEPMVLLNNEQDTAKLVEAGDALIFCNFRPDRAIQLTRAFVEDNFKGFERPPIADLYFVGMTNYSEQGTPMPKHIAFPPERIENYLGKVLSLHKLKQLRIAESEKFPHVTYFFNSGHRDIAAGETWTEIPSPKDVATYDEKPEMSQRWVTDVLLQKLDEKEFDFVLVNFAGPDMVAHTGVIDAAVKAMEIADECVGRVVERVLAKGGAVLITADHGNAEEMVNLQNGQPDTKHSTNQVPFIVIQNGIPYRELAMGNLADVAPTVLSLMGIEKPAEMTGRDLLAS